jgi:penicillin-binding protein 1C
LKAMVTTTTPPSPDVRAIRLLSPEASFIVLEMLRTNPRPSGDFSLSQVPSVGAVPWKTGTSYGYRDAWAIGIAGPYVLGVWIGNFDGTPNANFVGRDAAGPLFFNIVDALRAHGPLIESTVHGPLNLKKIKVCALSGQLPGPFCDHLKETWFIPGRSPITTCRLHRQVAVDLHSGLRACPERSSVAVSRVFEFWPSDLMKLFRGGGVGRRAPPPADSDCTQALAEGVAPLISSPSHGVIYSVAGGDRAQISLSAVTDADSRMVYWFIDDELVGTSRPGDTLFWKARPGTFIVRAVDEQGRAAAELIRVIPSVR